MAPAALVSMVAAAAAAPPLAAGASCATATRRAFSEASARNQCQQRVHLLAVSRRVYVAGVRDKREPGAELIEPGAGMIQRRQHSATRLNAAMTDAEAQDETTTNRRFYGRSFTSSRS